MRIADIKILNFRKLEEVSVDLRGDTTVFIGANNSGKTSAMASMRYFLNPVGYKNFNIYDFTISNHAKIKEIGKRLENEEQKASDTTGTLGEPEKRDLSVWKTILPSFDLWFDVGDDDIHYVSHMLPTLDWTGGHLGIRLRYEPKDVAAFYSAYKEARAHVEKLKENARANSTPCNVDLLPKDMFEFLKRDLQKYFTMKFYVLDPAQKDKEQETIGEPIEENPLIGLIQIDEINAQRGLNDEALDISVSDKRRLSQQLAEYYNQHLDPTKEPTEKNIKALDAIYKAQQAFTDSMSQGFQPALKELGTLGYPGFYNPNIKITPQLKPTDGLDHNAALEYPPIHLVLVEEPEAHLHPQAQQVFIKQAYKILTSRDEVKIGNLTTQLIISTHSSHITHECEFANLRYFRRIQPATGKVQSSKIINLSNVFGGDKNTQQFVSRYIKLTHCDLFFADAAILIEGDAERILLPHFLRKYDCLTQSYISILNIGGSHAHKLKTFMETLGIPTLIITDLDATRENEKKKWESAPVARGASQKTNNDTLKSWFPKKDCIDDLLGLRANDKKQDKPFALRVAYQIPITIGNAEVLPYTFEDSLIFENKAIFDGTANAKGMIKKAQNITDALSAFEIIRDSGFKKAEFALDLLYLENFDEIRIPTYISEGLQWLESILQSRLAQVTLDEDSAEASNAE